MSLMFTLLLVVQIISSLTIISLVLLQQGKGADMGSSFGSGSAGSLFGATGAANFMSRATKWAAVVFFISTIGLAYVANRGAGGQDTGLMSNFTQTQPAAPAPSGSLVPGSAPAGSASGSSAVPGATNAVPAVPGAPAAVPSAPVVPAPSSGVPATK